MKEDNVIKMDNISLIKDIQKQVPELSDTSINRALDDLKERQVMYNVADTFEEKKLLNMHKIEPDMCKNEACASCVNRICKHEQIRPVSCMYRLISAPPNRLDYDEYMPSHREALDMLEKHGLLKGNREEYRKANEYYGKAETRDERNKTEVKGITMAQAELCFRTAMKEYLDFLLKHGYVSQDAYDWIDPDVVGNNAQVELEKAMGIYPNIQIHD